LRLASDIDPGAFPNPFFMAAFATMIKSSRLADPERLRFAKPVSLHTPQAFAANRSGQRPFVKRPKTSATCFTLPPASRKRGKLEGYPSRPSRSSGTDRSNPVFASLAGSPPS
jgi:hypothetical protein